LLTHGGAFALGCKTMSMRRRHGYALTSLLCLLLFSESLLAQTVTVTFDNPPPPPSTDSYFNGIYEGIDFGVSLWRWSGPYASDPTNSIYFARSSDTLRSFSFSGGPRVLNRLSVYTTRSGTLTVSDGVNPNVTRTVTTGSMQQVATGWTQGATTITIQFSGGWSLGIDDIVYASSSTPPPPDTIPPAVSMTSPADGATVTGLVNLGANAVDNVAVAGVQFLIDGIASGPEDTTAPYAGAWNSLGANGGPHTITARARDGAGNVTTATLVTVTVSNANPGGSGYALRFYGNGVNDIDRVKIAVDDPATSLPGPPVDVGSTDFTVEFWVRGNRADNRAGSINCGANLNWIYGNVVVDRDRFNQNRDFGISFGAGRVAFGARLSTGRTICGSSDVLDGLWHHVAVQRRRSDGWMWLYVDGALEAQADGPDGDVSYPDAGVPVYRCGPDGAQQCTDSDPFIVLGAEKHDVGSNFPAYNGFFDELRVSRLLRYSGNFARPVAAFTTDASTVGLYHFDEGQGTIAYDTSGAAGGPSNGALRYGGNPAGPAWTTQSPFTSGP
jgi:hypothetical protein